jgi:hypothetical protein
MFADIGRAPGGQAINPVIAMFPPAIALRRPTLAIVSSTGATGIIGEGAGERRGGKYD